ncbi:hypothetical protein PFISCL1PPCAC_11759, partial [Pristionchus fissidentatus]
FALSSGRPIDVFHSYNTWIDAEMIVALPRMEELIVQQENVYMPLEGFSDEEVIAIAKQDHRVLQLSSNFSDPTTLPRLIEMVRSSEYMRVLKIDVPLEHFNDYLSTINLHEDENRLIDTKENKNVICIIGDSRIRCYLLNFGSWFMEVEITWCRKIWIYDYEPNMTNYKGLFHTVTLPVT